MNFKTFTSISSVKKYWKLIENENTNVYQTYAFNNILYKARKTSITNIMDKNNDTLFVVGFEESKISCIAALAINNKEKSISILGYGTNAGYLDFIYSENISDASISNLLNKCYEIYPNYKFLLTDIKGTSRLANALIKYNYKETECYAIKLQDSYEEYYQNLSKSRRQNIRTTYNRLSNDSINYSLRIYSSGDNINMKTLEKLNTIYRKRHQEWNGIFTENKSKSYNLLKKWQELNRDIIFKSIKKIPNAIVVVLEINNEPAAFMVAYIYKKSLIVPRLAIDLTYAKYSPGGLLIVEYIKYQYNSENGKDFVIDLCRGNEKYKSDYGGMLYFTKIFDFNVKSKFK